jgi:predicted acylesterase/phospholipase RssA
MIKELSIAGGGIKGIAYIAAVYELKKQGLIDNLEKVSGSSIGSFIAACIAIDLDLDELMDKIFKYDYNFLRDLDLKETFQRKSIMKGENVKTFFKEIIKENSELTLEELFEKSGIELIITTTCINTQTIEYLSYKTYPKLNLFKAICMSCAIPGIFPPVEHNGKIYVDGAILDNLPMSILSEDAVGICSTKQEKNKVITNELNFFLYFTIILRMVYNNFQRELRKGYKNTIIIDVKDTEVTSFDITKDEKLHLILCGRKAVHSYVSSLRKHESS